MLLLECHLLFPLQLISKSVFKLCSLRLHSHLTNYLLYISSWWLDHPLCLIVGRSTHIFQLYLTLWTKQPCSDLFWRVSIWLIPVIWFPVLGVLERGSVLASPTHQMQSSGRVCIFRTEACSCLRLSRGSAAPSGLRTACCASPASRSFCLLPLLPNPLCGLGSVGAVRTGGPGPCHVYHWVGEMTLVRSVQGRRVSADGSLLS